MQGKLKLETIDVLEILNPDDTANIEKIDKLQLCSFELDVDGNTNLDVIL